MNAPVAATLERIRSMLAAAVPPRGEVGFAVGILTDRIPLTCIPAGSVQYPSESGPAAPIESTPFRLCPLHQTVRRRALCRRAAHRQRHPAAGHRPAVPSLTPATGATADRGAGLVLLRFAGRQCQQPRNLAILREQTISDPAVSKGWFFNTGLQPAWYVKDGSSTGASSWVGFAADGQSLALVLSNSSELAGSLGPQILRVITGQDPSGPVN